MHVKLMKLRARNQQTHQKPVDFKDGTVDKRNAGLFGTRAGLFGCNGMVHEYYFDNLKRRLGDPGRTSVFIQGSRVQFRQLRGLEDGFQASPKCGAWDGRLLPQSDERPSVKPLDHLARDRKCGRVYAPARPGCGSMHFSLITSLRNEEIH
jgi:hypothetical protein